MAGDGSLAISLVLVEIHSLILKCGPLIPRERNG